MSEIPNSERVLLAGAERRMGLIILLLVPAGAVITAWGWGEGMAAAFVFGGLLAYLNYRWIVAVVDTLVRGQSARIPGRTYVKLFGPLGLLAFLLYVIFSRSLLAFAGVLGGLLLLVAAVVVEATVQIFLAVRD